MFGQSDLFSQGMIVLIEGSLVLVTMFYRSEGSWMVKSECKFKHVGKRVRKAMNYFGRKRVVVKRNNWVTQGKGPSMWI